MGTRGVVGFRMNNKDYITFNHWDSYPAGLGEDVMDFIREYKDKLLVLESKVEALTLVDDSEDNWMRYQHRRPMENFAGSTLTQKDVDGYDLHTILEVGVMMDNTAFANDSLFCEWGWIINLDTRTLEVYRGFQKEARGKGRFNKWKRKPKNWKPKYEGENYYFPISLVAEIPFDKLPDKGKLEEYVESILHENEEAEVA
jgi:hypothetical protein